ncbi:MAG TPA: acyl-CoA dehydrogenase family protein [Solirubrobacter sp.]|nr:acyl-CoA dehydrogenase family protein [Solirubrobacter sp.]
MDLTLSPAEQEFRDTLRAWIAEHHPGAEPEGDEASFEFRRAWQRKLNERGWAGLTWPSSSAARARPRWSRRSCSRSSHAPGRRRWRTCSG